MFYRERTEKICDIRRNIKESIVVSHFLHITTYYINFIDETSVNELLFFVTVDRSQEVDVI